MDDFGPKAVWIKISTFRGISIGAEHWYAYLSTMSKWNSIRGKESCVTTRGVPECPPDIPVEYPLSSKQAAMINKKDESRYGIRVQRGDLSTRFFDAETIIPTAINIFMTDSMFDPETDMLFIVDDPLYGSVKEDSLAVAGPSELVERFNQLNTYEERAEFLHNNLFTWTGNYIDD